jgi:hypothetical protein
MTTDPRSLTDEELLRDVYLDNQATVRERELMRRLEAAHDYISEIEEILVEHNIAEIHMVPLQ